MKNARGRTFRFASQKRMCPFLLFAFYFLLGVFSSAQGGTLSKTARLIPPETVLLVDIGSFSQLKGQFEKTTFYKLYKDPAMAAFAGDAKPKLREKIKEMSNELAKSIANTGVLPHGRAAFAIILNEQTKDAKELPHLLMTQWGEKVDKIKEYMGKMIQEKIEGGAHRKTEDYRGVSIETIFDKESTYSYCFIDDSFIVAWPVYSRSEAIKFVIAHIKGATSPTLADDADYNATMKTIGPYHDIDLYVNIKQIIKTEIAEDTTGKARTTIANLGFDNVTSLGGSIGVSREPGTSCSGKAFLKVDGEKKGICKMLEAESAVLRPPRFISASACSATFLNLDFKKVYDELVNVLTSFSPQAAAVMFMPLLPPSPDGEPGLELKRDIIEPLGSQILVTRSINKPLSANPGVSELLFALAVNDRRTLEKSLSLLHSRMMAPSDPDARRELLGHTIYLVSLPGWPFFGPGMTPMQGPPVGPDAAQMPKIAFTVTDTHLILGAESTVERAIRALSSAGTTSLGSAQWFTAAKSAIPSVVGLASLQDNASAGELSWWMMKESDKSKSDKSKSDSGDSTVTVGVGMSSNLGLLFSQTGLSLFNFSLLPEFDAVRKYFGLTTFYGVSRPDGFFFELNYLDPSGTD